MTLPPKQLPRAHFLTPGDTMQIKTPILWARDLQYLIRLIDKTPDPQHTTRVLAQLLEASNTTPTPKTGLRAYLHWRQHNSRS